MAKPRTPRRTKKTAPPNWLPVFLHFFSLLRIDSKEMLGDEPVKLYEAQLRFLEQVSSGLQDDCHFFINLKARQLGISTVMLALDIFWLYMNPGLQGALVTDSAENVQQFRQLIVRMLESLPKGFKIPIRQHNRSRLVLANGSTLQYMSAGKGKNSGLGRSRALNFAHCSEISGWGDQKGIDSLKAALAEHHPARLYVFESTALGFNVFYDLYNEAKDDGISKRAFFIGWWAKETYVLERGSAEFDRYWTAYPQLTEAETETATQVLADYGHVITEEQWAWYRKKGYDQSEESLKEEYPSTAEEAWVATGSAFFSGARITQDINFIYNMRVSFTGHTYKLGDQYLHTKLLDVTEVSKADLRVWEEPKRGGKYVFGVDPAYGSSDEADRTCISVWRCYADKLVQVAEYATTVPNTNQCAWVMAHLAGSYRDCMVNLEVNGPGSEVMNALKELRQKIRADQVRDDDHGLKADTLDQLRWFMWKRPDSMTGIASVYNWTTRTTSKSIGMNKLRDAYNMEQLVVRSIPLLEEMQTLRQDGDSIAASGRKKDDRVMAAMMACYAWSEWVKTPMMMENRTFDREMASQAALVTEANPDVSAHIVTNFLKKRADEREERAFQQLLEGRY